jgi:hypothetical protein
VVVARLLIGAAEAESTKEIAETNKVVACRKFLVYVRWYAYRSS